MFLRFKSSKVNSSPEAAILEKVTNK